MLYAAEIIHIIDPAILGLVGVGEPLVVWRSGREDEWLTHSCSGVKADNTQIGPIAKRRTEGCRKFIPECDLYITSIIIFAMQCYVFSIHRQ
jgi:hypothetical protein